MQEPAIRSNNLKFEEIKKITVIGAGTMGNGIAHSFAQYGYNVVLNDISKEFLDKAIHTINSNLDRQIKKGVIKEGQKQEALGRIGTSINLEEACHNADLIIEAIIEKESLKKNLFKDLDRLSKTSAILASNTSSISISSLASSTTRPQNVIGMHFMNPVPMMKLVEVIK